MRAERQSDIPITPAVRIAPDAMRFEYSRSGGPGGQNVNKVNTRVMLRFHVAACETLDEQQKQLVRRHLRTRITLADELLIVVSKHRTQAANRNEAVERFVELLREALRPRRARRKTRVPTSAKNRRLKEKKHRGEVKQLRVRGVDAE